MDQKLRRVPESHGVESEEPDEEIVAMSELLQRSMAASRSVAGRKDAQWLQAANEIGSSPPSRCLVL